MIRASSTSNSADGVGGLLSSALLAQERSSKYHPETWLSREVYSRKSRPTAVHLYALYALSYVVLYHKYHMAVRNKSSYMVVALLRS